MKVMKSGLLNLLQYKFIRLWQILDLLVSQQGFQHLISSKLVGFCESNFDRIAEETNRFARQAMETQADSAWRELDAKEIRAFFSVNVLFGIKQLPEVYS